MIEINFVPQAAAASGPVALPIAQGAVLADVLPASILDTATLVAGSFTGKSGTILDFPAMLDGQLRRVLLVGTGEDGDGAAAGSKLAAHLLTSGATSLTVDAGAIPAADRATFAAALAEGAMLRSWRYDLYRTELPEAQRPTLKTIDIVVGDAADQAQAAWTPRKAAVEGVAFARMLVTEPGNVIYPESFVGRCGELAALGIKIEVLDEPAMRALGMGALLGVAQGSIRAPRLLCMTWDGTGGTADPVALVGKGVTFDTGGISIKPAQGMEGMKWDMGGAAAVAGAMKTLALRQANAHVIGVCGLVENMPDGGAMRPGDVVTTMSGRTVEVINTDAEGRLVLCDALTWVQRTHGVKTIVDLATLTGAILISLGHEYGGLFTNSDDLAAQLSAAGEAVDEKLWRMPMAPAFDKLIDSPIADMKNVGPREAGSATAAIFLQRFIEDGVRWAHLDIAGMAWAPKAKTLYGEGATGYGVRLLDRYVRDAIEGAGGQ